MQAYTSGCPNHQQTLGQHDDYIDSLPLCLEEKQRVKMTVRGPDCETIPKVGQAGETIVEDGTRLQLMHNGIRVVEDCYCGRLTTEIIRLLRGHHEPQEEKVFHELLKHITGPALMLELGSYWSYYSLWFQHQVRHATSYLVEPDPICLEVGKRNFELNNATGHFYQYVVARESSLAKPFWCETAFAEHSLARTSVDDFLENHGIGAVDLLLADIQGAELEMLEGAARSIQSGKVRFVLISTHHHSISQSPLTHQGCLRFVKEQGGHVLAEHNVMESFSGDGLIAASFHADDRCIPEIQISRNYASNSLFRELEWDLADAWKDMANLRGQISDLQIRLMRLAPLEQLSPRARTLAAWIHRFSQRLPLLKSALKHLIPA